METERETLIELLSSLEDDEIKIEQSDDILRDAFIVHIMIPKRTIWERGKKIIDKA